MEKVKYKFIALAVIIAVIAFFLPLGLEQKAQLMLSVMVLAVLLWIFEAVPLHATAILVALLLITVVGLSEKEVFAQFFDSNIVLLLGGFVIAVAMSKHKLDEYIAFKILKKSGTSARLTVLALLGTTTFLSMWISNSAAAAIIMPIAIVILVKNNLIPGKSNLGKAFVLAVGFGATIGGIGTIVGSTPNIIAAKFINDAGISYGFFDWFYRGFPFMLVLMFLAWIVLMFLFKPEVKQIQKADKELKISKEQLQVLGIFVLTILLWVTESIHGIKSSNISLVPIILFYFSGLLSTDDFKKIDWPTLILIGGGLALGFGIHSVGLDAKIASLLAGMVAGKGLLFLFLMLGIFGVLLTVFISNTTAAAIYLPIVVALASSFGIDPASTITAAAIGVSLDFIFPFGTPPTAIAYRTGYVNTKEIAIAGVCVSILGIILLALMAGFW
ncbi:MAG: DASS family sodium-coupled anion symporter [archaeon]|nr:DASS family sodium-coupled anion symporter [archaeon]